MYLGFDLRIINTSDAKQCLSVPRSILLLQDWTPILVKKNKSAILATQESGAADWLQVQDQSGKFSKTLSPKQ